MKKKRTFKKKKKIITYPERHIRPVEYDDVRDDIIERIVTKDNIAKGKFPAPKDNRIFVARWNSYIEDVVKRENFKPGHLSQLAVLCDLYVEYARLEAYIEKHGYSYESVGRNGIQYKIHPEVAQLNRTRSEIRNYSRTLGLLLVKDKDLTANEDEKADDWE